MTRAIAAGILGVLLVAPLAAPLCAAGVCDPGVTCEVAMRPAGSGDVPELVGPDCCLNVPVAAAEPDAATDAVSPSAVGPAQLTVTAAAAPPRHPHAATLPAPARTGRTTLSLHQTLLL
ncbi:MAG: hypothetical protein ACRD2Z_07740 [Thermoanaerobaculia bacterium]